MQNSSRNNVVRENFKFLHAPPPPTLPPRLPASQRFSIMIFEYSRRSSAKQLRNNYYYIHSTKPRIVRYIDNNNTQHVRRTYA